MYMDNNDTCVSCDRIGEEMLGKLLDLPPSERPCTSRCAPTSSWGLPAHPLGMVYAPLQEFTEIYDRTTALSQGTVFRALDLPFMGESVRKGGGCRG